MSTYVQILLNSFNPQKQKQHLSLTHSVTSFNFWIISGVALSHKRNLSYIAPLLPFKEVLVFCFGVVFDDLRRQIFVDLTAL